MGYKCPDCIARDGGSASDEGGNALGAILGRAGRGRQPVSGVGSGPGARSGPGFGDRLPFANGARGTLAGHAAATLGGLVLGPVMVGGAFFLLSSGVIGWAVARAVYWATAERNSPYVRAIALTLAGFTVAIGLIAAGRNAAPTGLLFLAYPAAVYGGWIVVRQR